jgi:hypothetical protein
VYGLIVDGRLLVCRLQERRDVRPPVCACAACEYSLQKPCANMAMAAVPYANILSMSFVAYLVLVMTKGSGSDVGVLSTQNLARVLY